jgi:hypothetical protein
MWSSKARLGKRKGLFQYSQDKRIWKVISHGLNELNEFNPWLILTQVEAYLDPHRDVDGCAILHAGPEPPFLDGIDRILVETEAKTPYDVNQIDESIFSDKRFKNHSSLEASFPRFFGIFRIDAIN